MTAKRIEVAGLRTATEMRSAIADRQGNVGRAEEFVRSTFGPETLKYMTDLRDAIGRRPAFALARQIAKPDMQHAALYVASEGLGCTLVTLEWTKDFMSMQGGYKRSYVDLPMGYIGNKGNLVSKHVKVLPKLSPATPVVQGRVRICDVEIPESGIALLKQQLSLCMCAQLAASLEGRSHKIQELHCRIRSGVEGDNQLVPDVSELGELAVRGLLRSGASVPGLKDVSYSPDSDSVRVDRIGGQFMYVLDFTLPNVIPNLVLAVTDWNGDDEIIRSRYDSAVSFLRGRGLNEPLQFIVPSLHQALGEPISGSDATLDTVIPARKGLCRLARPQPADELDRTFIEAGRSIVEGMRSAKKRDGANGDVVNN
jgi:hypothetical protein